MEFDRLVKEHIHHKDGVTYFVCTRDQNYAPVEWRELIVPQELKDPSIDMCWNAQVHISIAKQMIGLMDDCDKHQQMSMMRMGMILFYKHCVQGRHDECFQGIQGIGKRCIHHANATTTEPGTVDSCPANVAQFEGCFHAHSEHLRCDDEVMEYFEDLKMILHQDAAARGLSHYEVVCEFLENFMEI